MKKFLSVLALAGVALATALAAPVSAAQVTIRERSEVSTANIVRTINGESNPTTVSFTYAMTEDEDNPAPIGGLADFQVDFVEVVPQGGVARVEQTVDLGDLSFSKVGDYRIHVREVASSDSENYPVDGEAEYELVVAVRNRFGADGRYPTGQLTANLVPQVVDTRTGEKADAMSFASTAQHTFILLNKMVVGDAADTEEYFRFSVQFMNTPTGQKYTVTGQDAVVFYDGQTISTSKKLYSDAENYVYLKAGQYLTIGLNGDTNELPIGAQYQITEEGAEGYVTYVDGAERFWKTSAVKTAAFRAPGDIRAATWTNNTSFENEKNGDVLTGINSLVWPFVGLLAIGVVGAGVYLVLTKKKR